MTHRMKLNPQPFRLIACGQKTIELRLYDEKRRLLRVGERIEFTNTADPAQTVNARILALHRFDSFARLYEALPLDKCGYLPHELASARPEDMLAYYSREQQAHYGVVGIEIQLI